MWNVKSCRKIWLWDIVINYIKPRLKMVFLCFRKCSKTKRIAVYEPELIEKNSTFVENPRNESKENTSDERKISIDQYSHYFIDEYASGQFSFRWLKLLLWLVNKSHVIIGWDSSSNENLYKQDNQSTTERTAGEWPKTQLLASEGIVMILCQKALKYPKKLVWETLITFAYSSYVSQWLSSVHNCLRAFKFWTYSKKPKDNHYMIKVSYTSSLEGSWNHYKY